MFLVLAYGNPLRRDDGFAWRAAGLLVARSEDAGLELREDHGPKPESRLLDGSLPRPLVDIRTLHQLTPELSEDVAAADGVVFLDARANGVPGEIRVSPVVPGGESSPLAHSVAPSTLLALGLHLYGRTPPALLVTVTGEVFDLGEGLSEIVESSLETAVDRVVSAVKHWNATL